MTGFLAQLARATGRDDIDVHYEEELKELVGFPGTLKEFRTQLEAVAELLPLPDVLQGKVPPKPGQGAVFVVVSTLREGFLVRIWRLRPLAPRGYTEERKCQVSLDLAHPLSL